MALVFLNEPEAPVLCALEIAARLREQSQIQLRMGVHYGPIRLHENINGNKDVVGEGIILAQRVMDCGDAGHILLSPMVAEVLRQSGNWEPYLTDLGECAIKHGQRLRVFNLVKEGVGNPARPIKLISLPGSQASKDDGSPPSVDTAVRRDPLERAKPISVLADAPQSASMPPPAEPASPELQRMTSPPSAEGPSHWLVVIALGVVAFGIFGYYLRHFPARPNRRAAIERAEINALLAKNPSPNSAHASSLVSARTNPKDSAEMILIPAGAFLMGSQVTESTYQDEKPQRAVTLDSYYIYKNLVTVKQYLAFCDATGHARPEAPGANVNWKKTNHPIVNVSWDDAKAYCDWAGTALPTEAQWEKAARGTDGRRYPWGNDWDGSRCANSVSPSQLAGTVEVGHYLGGASPYGVLDMAGNVWEWCQDYYDAKYYDRHESDPRNPVNYTPGEHGDRVMRGGSWGLNDPGNFRCASRGKCYPPGRNFFFGFRCVAYADTR